MEFNEVENLSEAQILEFYSDVLESPQVDLIAGQVAYSEYYDYTTHMYYTEGCLGSYYGRGINCGVHTTFGYLGGADYCNADYKYVIGSYYLCDDMDAK